MSVAEPIYEEEISSTRTEALFVGLTCLFLGLLSWTLIARGGGPLSLAFLLLVLFFLFCSLNYRTLVIRLSSRALVLEFGVFTWKVELENIEACDPDDISIWRIGGAGIHFTFIRRRYRAFLNFLDHPRVVISLKERKGPVREISFSTDHPDEVVRLIRAASAGALQRGRNSAFR